METKEQLINIIKQWVKLDNDIHKLKKEEKQRKDEKKEVSVKLIEIMKNNEIDCFDIKDGQICYSKKSIKKPITKKILMELLTTYFKGDALKASDVNNFIIENREEVIKETIVRKINKDLD